MLIDGNYMSEDVISSEVNSIYGKTCQCNFKFILCVFKGRVSMLVQFPSTAREVSKYLGFPSVL